MARDDGFPVMDVSTDLLNDPKFRRIARETPALVAPAFTAYVATMAESWKAGRRTSVIDSWPVVIPFDEPTVSALQTVELIDPEGCIPTKTWKGWFGPAKKRRDAARDRWRRANDKRAHPRSEDSADTSRIPRGYRAVTASTVPSVPYRPKRDKRAPTAGGRAREAAAPDEKKNGHQAEPDLNLTLSARELEAWTTFGREWDAFKAAWLQRGFRLPPAGGPDDDDTSQRGMLYAILDARPNDLPAWVLLAKGTTPREVIAWVLDAWHGVRQAATAEAFA